MAPQAAIEISRRNWEPSETPSGITARRAWLDRVKGRVCMIPLWFLPETVKGLFRSDEETILCDKRRGVYSFAKIV